MTKLLKLSVKETNIKRRSDMGLISKFAKKVTTHIKKGKDLKIKRERKKVGDEPFYGTDMNEATHKIVSSDPKIAAEGRATLDKRFKKRNKIAKLRIDRSATQKGGPKAPRPLDLWEGSSSTEKKVLIKEAKKEGILSRKTLPINKKRLVRQPRPASANVTPSGLEGVPGSSLPSPTRLDVHAETPNYPAMTKVVRDIKKASAENPYKIKADKESPPKKRKKENPELSVKQSSKKVTSLLKKIGVSSKEIKHLDEDMKVSDPSPFGEKWEVSKKKKK